MKLSGGVHVDNDYTILFERIYRLLIFVLMFLVLTVIANNIDYSTGDLLINILIASSSFLFVERMYPSVIIENKY